MVVVAVAIVVAAVALAVVVAAEGVEAIVVVEARDVGVTGPDVPLTTVDVVVVAGSPTAIGLDAPNVPVELSVTFSSALSGSTRVTLTVAKPSLNTTLLPAAQSPAAGYPGALPSGALSGPVKVTQRGPV